MKIEELTMDFSAKIFNQLKHNQIYILTISVTVKFFLFCEIEDCIISEKISDNYFNNLPT